MPLPVNAQPIPITYREVQDHCGPAAVRAVLRYRLGRDVPELTLVGQLKTTHEVGTPPDAVVRVLAHDYGLKSALVEHASLEDLRSTLKRGETAMSYLQAWWPDEEQSPPLWATEWEHGHVIVIIGIDDEYVYAMDPSLPDAYGALPIEEFLERWHDRRLLEDGTERRYLQSFIRVGGGQPLSGQLSTSEVQSIG